MTNKLVVWQTFFRHNLTAQLAAIAGLSGLLYALLFTLPFPLTRLYHSIPPLDYAKLTHHSPGGLAAYGLGLGALFWLYLWALQLTAPTGQPLPVPTPQQAAPSFISARFILLSNAALAAVNILAYPLTAIDLFVYAIWTRGWALYGLNPLAARPAMLPAADPWLNLAGEWLNASSPYGPAWELLSLAAFYLSGGGFLAHLLALKILAGLASLGCAGLIYQILRRLQPQWAAAGTIAFAWNPLVLLETAQNGHNDIVMVFFLLAAVWVWVRFWSESARGIIPLVWVCLLLALSILVKFVTALAAPFLLLALAAAYPRWPQRLTVLALGGLLIAGLVIAALIPFWPGWDHWAVLQANSGAGRSLLALLALSLQNFWGLNTAFDVARNFIFAVFALIYLYYLGYTLHWGLKNSQRLATGSTFSALAGNSVPPVFYTALAAVGSVLFWYVLLAAPVFHAWYLLWFIPLAALLLPYRRLLRASIVFSITALLVIPYFETVRVWLPLLLGNQLLGHLIGVPLLIVPPVWVMLKKEQTL